MSIGTNIKKLRLLHDMSQQDLARIAGVTDKAVSSWENGIKTPRLKVLQKIADHFNIKKSDIIEGIKDCDHQPIELQDALDNLYKAIYGLNDNYSLSQMDEVANATETYVTAIAATGNLRDAFIVAESIYLGALLGTVKRFEDIAKKYLAIRERYLKQLESVKDKEVWE